MGIDKKVLTLGLGAGLFFSSAALSAVNLPGYEGELKTQVEFRQDIYDEDSVPFDSYLKLDIRDLKGESTLHFYGKLWKDLGYGTDTDVDIYQIYVEIPFRHSNSSLLVGRQFISEGFETYVADAVKFQQTLSNGFRYVFYLGKPRFFEPKVHDGDDFLAGVKFEYKGYFFGVEHLRNDGHVKKTSLVAGSYTYLSKNLVSYSRFELDTAHGEFVEANLGFNYFPTRKLRLNVEFGYADYSYRYDDYYYEDPVFSMFSPEGRELRLTQSAYYDLSKEWQLFETLTITDIQREGKDNGELLKLGVIRDRWFEKGLRTHAAFLYQNSWIGILRGVEFGFTKWLCKKFTLSGLIDIARFDKVTYGKQWADAYYLKGTYNVTEFSSFELGVDYRRNEDFDRDARVILRYNYLFWGGSGKREKAEEERK